MARRNTSSPAAEKAGTVPPPEIADIGARIEAALEDPRIAALSAVRRVRTAHEQVADQLRALILSGKVAQGERLPNETVLAKEFGVSRATVREALRTLSAERLIVTVKGATGGSFVTSAGFDFISEFLQVNLRILTEMKKISLSELLETREHLEVYAAKLAAERRTADDLDRLQRLLPASGDAMGEEERFGLNISFHSVLMEVSRNSLLYIAALPVFNILQTNLSRGDLTPDWHKAVTHQHADIADAVEAKDSSAAARLMEQHLAFIRPEHERNWRHA